MLPALQTPEPTLQQGLTWLCNTLNADLDIIRVNYDLEKENTYCFINWGEQTSVPSQARPATKRSSVEPVPGATEEHSLSREQLGAGGELCFSLPAAEVPGVGAMRILSHLLLSVWPARVLHLQEGPLVCCSELPQARVSSCLTCS